MKRLESYARLFCTPRSFERGTPRLLEDGELTPDERERLLELKEELNRLRELAAHAAPASESMWHFPDNSRVTLVCSRLSGDRRHADDRDPLQYVRFADLAD